MSRAVAVAELDLFAGPVVMSPLAPATGIPPELADRAGYHQHHGAYVQATPFVKWLGYRNVKTTIDDNLQPGDFVKGVAIATPSSGRQRATILTKRGVRRLLFRSNKPVAIEYADRVLDMLDELDRSGMVVDEKRITDEQIIEGKQRLDNIAQRRLEEKQDYRSILHSLKRGGAVTDDYRHVQDTLYLQLFGMRAAQIRAGQPQRNGVLRKRGAGFRKSTVAKDFLTEQQIALLNSTVLATIAQIQLRYPNGATAGQMVDAINRAVGIIRIGAAL